jgi:hypothetical protein
MRYILDQNTARPWKAIQLLVDGLQVLRLYPSEVAMDMDASRACF